MINLSVPALNTSYNKLKMIKQFLFPRHYRNIPHSQYTLPCLPTQTGWLGIIYFEAETHTPFQEIHRCLIALTDNVSLFGGLDKDRVINLGALL
ncbi:hypothetical protein HZS_1251 [Henneguya salminicola]|nr:hypothetical protein HZS_1251 [Henneguya salminicola]